MFASTSDGTRWGTASVPELEPVIARLRLVSSSPPQPVADGVIRIKAPLPISEPDHVNCYLLSVGSEQMLVDTGMRGSELAIDDLLRRLGAQVDRVLITHGHPDHWGNACRYADAALAHPGVVEQLEFARSGGSASGAGLPPGTHLDHEVFEYLAGFREFVGDVPAVEPIVGGDRLGDWQVLITPGHAPGHVCLYRERDGVLIAGDHLLPTVTPNIHLTTEMPDAVADYLASLRRVAEMDVQLVLPAHGEPFTDARGRANELIAHHERRLARLEDLLEGDGPSDTARLAERLFRDLTAPGDRLLAEMETYAHLEHLRLRGRVLLAGADTWQLAA
jgi:glyoxylase-like metal-dependent hydrolase (beta-lactamase superfamily II)